MPDVGALLSVKVTADTSEAESGLARLNSQVSSTGSAIATAFGTAAVAGIAAMGGALVGSIKTAADFEKQMSAVGAVAGASASEMQQLTGAALQLGKDTSFSASEAAKGIEELVKAGVGIQDVIGGGARAALDLAAAGAISVGDAAEIASNAMNVFGKSGADMAHVADVIAGAANASAIGVNDYKFSLSAAGAVAATVGISFESLSQAIAVMGNAGIKGSDSGTSLKTMLLNLQPTTKAQIAEFERLGIATINGGEAFSTLKAALIATAEGQKAYDKMTKAGTLTTENMWKAADKLGLAAVKGTESYERWLATSGNLSNSFFDAEGKAKSFAEISEVLKTAMAGMTKQQQLASLEILFGADAIRAGAVMAEAGAEGFNQMAEAMGKVTAQQVAEERLNNLAGSFEKLTGSLETGAIILGGMFTPALKGMVDVLTDQVNVGIDVLEQIPDVIATIQQVLAGDWAPDASIRPFTNAVGEAAIVFRDQFLPTIMTVADFVTGTLVPAFVAIGTFLADHAELIAGVAAAWASFAILSAVAGWITGAIAAFGAMSTAITAAGGVIAAIIAILGGPLTLAILAVAAIVGVLTAAWIGNWGDIQGKTAIVAAWLGTALTEVGAFLTQLGAESVILWQMMVTSWDGIVAATTAAWTAVTAAVQAGWDGTVALFTASMAAVQAVWDAGWALIRSIALAAWNLLSAENQAKVTELVALITTLWQLLPALWTAGTALVTTTVTAWWAALTALWTTSTTAITTTTTTWWAALTTLWTTSTTAITTLVTTWWTTISTAWTAGMKVITDLIAPWWAAIRALWQAAHDAIVAGVQAFFKLVSDAWTAATTTLSGIAASLGTAIMDALLGALNAAAGSVVDSVIGTVRRAIEGARSLISGFGPGTPGSGPVSQRGGYDDLAVAAAKKYGLEDPEGFAAQLRQESGDYAPDVVSGQRKSSSGATGIAQFMPGTAAQYGVDPTDPIASIDAAARYMADLKAQTGSQREAAARYYGAPSASSMDGRHYLSSIEAKRGNVRVTGGPAGQMGDVSADLKIDQTAWAAGMSGAAAICGPYAASIFADYVGRPPTPREAGALAQQFGWSPTQGMTQSDKVDDLANAFIQNANPGSGMRVSELRTGDFGVAGRTAQAGLTGGAPVGFNTQAHYFVADDFNAASGAFHVGATGTTMRGGSEWMTIDQIAAVGQGLLGVLTISGQAGQGFVDLGAEAQTGFGMVTQGGITAGQALVSTSTDALGNVTTLYSDATGVIGATITDAAGQIVNTWGTMTTGVTEQTGTMAQTALTSVTDLGGSILTTMTDSAGSTIATVAGMSGQVTSQYATLANGVSLTMGDMAAGVMTSTTDLGTGMLTVMQDAAGNYVATVTDLAGNVTSQYTQLATDVVATTVAQSEGVQTETATMSEAVLTSVTDMGDGIITITTDSSGQMVATITDMAGNVTSTYSTMSTDVVGSVTDLGETVVEQFGNVASEAQDAIGPIEDFGSALIDIPQADMSDTVKQFGQAAEAAKKAQKAIKALADATEDLPGKFGGSKGGNSGLGKKAAGGWTVPDQTTLVGELGPELISTSRPMYVTPNDRLMAPAMSGGTGGMQTIRLQVEIGGKVAQEIYITGQRLAVERGRA